MINNARSRYRIVQSDKILSKKYYTYFTKLLFSISAKLLNINLNSLAAASLTKISDRKVRVNV